VFGFSRLSVSESGHAPELAEEPHGAEGAQGADHAHVQERGAREGRDGEDDDGGVHDVVAVAKESAQPVGIQVDEELGDEEAREEEVHALKVERGGGLGAVGAGQLGVELGLGDIDSKVLVKRKCEKADNGRSIVENDGGQNQKNMLFETSKVTQTSEVGRNSMGKGRKMAREGG
jgi:hypothetical protein